MKALILSASVEFLDQPFLKPLQLSSGLITKATEARVQVLVRVGEQEATGRGSIYLSDLWAWPGGLLQREAKEAAMRALCRDLANDLASACGGEACHPLELGLRLHLALEKLGPEMPLLARAVCASPFDAAIHDAVGLALGVSAFRFYEVPEPIPSADHWFRSGGTCQAIQGLLQKPRRQLAAWWLVSARDDLETQVRPAVAHNGIRSFKIKILGQNNTEDARRTVDVFQAARRWGLDPILSIDSNEGNPDTAAVLDYLDCLRVEDSEAYGALAYLEQPTARDISAHPFDWRQVTKRKPVLLDEGLTSLDLLPLLKDQSWSGLAMKTCKGHSFALVSAAWAHERKLVLALQDLTNPGYSAVHSFLFGAHLPTINGIELNSPQYTPAANEPWLPALSGLFRPKDGVHRLEEINTPGLGSALKDCS